MACLLDKIWLFLVSIVSSLAISVSRYFLKFSYPRCNTKTCKISSLLELRAPPRYEDIIGDRVMLKEKISSVVNHIISGIIPVFSSLSLNAKKKISAASLFIKKLFFYFISLIKIFFRILINYSVLSLRLSKKLFEFVFLRFHNLLIKGRLSFQILLQSSAYGIKLFETKKADLKKVTFVFMIALMSYFLFLSVLPGNERILPSVCAFDDCLGFDGDIDETSCSAYGRCNGGPGWTIGGDADIWTNYCCGDDISEEWVINETSSTDAPGGYNDRTGACCDAISDCDMDDICFASNRTSSSSIPNKAWCYYNIWYGGDKNSSACYAVAGSNRWDIGGESISNPNDLCCGDDTGEYNMTANFDLDMDGSSDNSDACCSAATDCVNASNCFDTGMVHNSVDLNTDTDYCLNGVWYDCLTNADCNLDEICYTTDNECIPKDGFIKIYNFGITRIENISNDFTSIRNVILETNFTDNAEQCRYINYDNPFTRPSDSSLDWSVWESCVRTRIWVLSESNGNKTVYYQINYSDPKKTVVFNDSIYYNYTGAGLDTTPPTEPAIIDGDYTNNNQSVTISWYGASDPESEVLGIPLRYEYVLYHENGTILDTYLTDSTTHTSDISAYNINHSTRLYVNITVINSAWLTEKNTSDGLTVDLQEPSISSLRGNYYNLSNQQYETILGINNWVYANSVNFSWLGLDNFPNNIGSGIGGFSYVLTTNPNSIVDDVPEGDINDLSGETGKVFIKLKSGTYYFYIKAKDEAGNWGEVSSMNFSIDNTPPGKPGILTEEREGTDVTYIWSESSDPETGIEQYMINLSYPDGSYYKSNITDSSTTELTFVGIGTGLYNVTVGAMNGVGIWRWSNEEEVSSDSTPPELRATPNRTVITNTPILRAWTDEQAYCVYNISDTEYEFAYTNTTYHEAKTNYLSEGGHYVTITCEDMSGNEAGIDLNFTINTALTQDNVDGPLSINTYQNLLTTISIDIDGGGVLLAGIKPERFSMQLDGEDKEISVFDKGDGSYNLSFYSPDYSNTYNLILNLDGAQIFTSNLIVHSLFLAVTYSNPGISSTNTSHITYYETNEKTYGLASDKEMEDLAIISGENNLSMSNIRQGENLFIFSTKSGLSVNSREELLESRNFMNKVIPSFGYQLDDTYIIHFILRYDSFAIESEVGDVLEKGRYNLFTRRTFDSIIFTDKQDERDRVVLTGG